MDYSNMTLMEAILKSGYPSQDISHHESDLYVFVTKETTQVINDWFKQHNMNQDLFVSKFKDQITGRLMYDLAFAFEPYWEEKRNQYKDEDTWTQNYKKWKSVTDELKSLGVDVNVYTLFRVRDLIGQLETEKRCPKCGCQLLLSDLKQYDYLCPECDENFDEVEVK